MTPFLPPLLLAALGVVSATSGYTGVVYLVALFTLASLAMLGAGVGFLAYAYLLVYVGAIAVLVLFVVMLAGSRGAGSAGLSSGGSTALSLAGLSAGCLLWTWGLPTPSGALPLASGASLSPASSSLPLVSPLYLGELLPMTLLVALILLFAMAGAVALAKDA